MAILSPNESKSATTAGAAAVEIQYDMQERRQYRLTARGAPLWFAVVAPGGAGAAVAGDGSHFLFTGETFDVARIKGIGGVDRTRISIIRDGGTDATGVLSEIAAVQPF